MKQIWILQFATVQRAWEEDEFARTIDGTSCGFVIFYFSICETNNIHLYLTIIEWTSTMHK